MPKSEQELRGLGGWLILLAIALMGLPGHLHMHAEQMAQQFNIPGIREFITPENAAYDPRWKTLFMIETSAHTLAIIPAVFLILLFVFRHRLFPGLFSSLASYFMLLAAVRCYLVLSTPTIARSYQSPIVIQTALTLVVFGAWIVYAFRSRRVRLTFTRQLFFRPYFPFLTQG